MTRENMVSHVERWFEEVWNQRNDAVMDEMMAEDVWIEGFTPDETTAHGIDHFKSMRVEILKMFPDIHITVDRVVVDGEESVAWLTCRGTAEPTAFGLVCDAKSVEFHTVAWAIVRDGKYIGGRNLIDFGAAMRQLQN